MTTEQTDGWSDPSPGRIIVEWGADSPGAALAYRLLSASLDSRQGDESIYLLSQPAAENPPL